MVMFMESDSVYKKLFTKLFVNKLASQLMKTTSTYWYWLIALIASWCSPSLQYRVSLITPTANQSLLIILVTKQFVDKRLEAKLRKFSILSLLANHCHLCILSPLWNGGVS